MRNEIIGEHTETAVNLMNVNVQNERLSSGRVTLLWQELSNPNLVKTSSNPYNTFNYVNHH